ncbi:glycosyltransferase family 4 protein [Curtobacterium sp. MCBA15_012]|uniref:glycosyltransferase family 4 protein n=1 Tax=Curtobacterium sp. MCBA15_012 TaxID=1898738 RepID=UPI001587BE83|nr:glycosyltransferase family 4 protein [Curtobacterium sp. MCBA15_012]WIB00731.1 glycosyltransferase family 4 protein [Curtobacterium sp. MCBA15_012]
MNTLVQSLLELGHEVVLVTASVDVERTWRADNRSLTVVVVPYRSRARHRALDFFRAERTALREAIEQATADVYHAHWTYEFALACLDARVSPLLVTAHDAPVTVLRRMPDTYRLIRLLMAVSVRLRASHLSFVTPYLAKRWQREMRYRRPTSVITNPTPALASPTGRRSPNLTILDVANGSRLKNVKALLRAFKLIKVSAPCSQLRLVGPGLEPDGKLAGWAGDQGLSDGVHFLGELNREDLAVEYQHATIFCHPSLEESHGIALLEAIHFGLPVVAGVEAGAVGWTLFDGEAGVLVDVNDPRELAKAILALDQDQEASAELVQRARLLAQERYAPQAVAARYIEEYNALSASSEIPSRG